MGKDELRAENVKKGEVLPFYRNGKIEAYGILVEASDESSTFSENGKVYRRERWLIEWIDFQNYPNIPTSHNLRTNQKYYTGKKTHRNVEYFVIEEKQEYKIRSEMRESSSTPFEEIQQQFYTRDKFLKVNGKEIY